MLRVPYGELMREGESPLRTITTGERGVGTATQIFRVPDAHEEDALKQLVGYSYLTWVGASRAMFRELAQPYPGNLGLYCVSAQTLRHEAWRGRANYDPATFGQLPGSPNRDATKDAAGNHTNTNLKKNVYKWAVIQANFEQADFFIRNDQQIYGEYGGNEIYRFVKFKQDRSMKAVSIRGQTLYFVLPRLPAEPDPAYDARRTVLESPGKHEFSRTLYYTWKNVPLSCFPQQTWDGMIGKTNSRTFPEGNGFPPGTLLMMPYRSDEPYPNAENYPSMSPQLTLEYFEQGWNKILHAPPGGPIAYKYVTPDKAIEAEPDPAALPAGKFIHDSADFNQLFLVANP